MERMVIKRWRLLWVFLFSFVLLAPQCEANENLPLRVRKVILQAQQLMAQQQYDGALTVLDSQRQLEPHHYLVDFTLGNIYLLSERHAEAVEWYESVVRQNPSYSSAWLNVAQCYYVLERYLDAAQAFEQSYRLITPSQPQLRYNAALAYLQGEDPAAAVALLNQLVSDFPDLDSVPWRSALVQCYNLLEQPQLALPHLEFLANTTRGDEQRRWRELLVQHYLILKMVDKAFNAVDSYTKIDGLEPLWWKLLTSIHLDGGRYNKGLVTLKVLAYLQPLTEQEQHLLADLYLTLGVPQEAIRYYEMLQQQHPHDEQLLTRLAHASLNFHQPEDALHWLQQAQSDTVDVKLLMLQGQLLFSLQRYGEAVELFGRVAELEKDSGAAWLMQGYAAWNGKLWAQARNAFENAQRYPQQKKKATVLLKQLSEVELR